MQRIKILVLFGFISSLWSVQLLASTPFNMEFSDSSFMVSKVDYRNRIIYTMEHEFTYNAKTRFVYQAKTVKPSAVKKGALIRFKISPKVKSTRRPLLSEVTIRLYQQAHD